MNVWFASGGAVNGSQMHAPVGITVLYSSEKNLLPDQIVASFIL